LIMVHGDDKGLRLPPRLAPVQIVIIPIIKNDDDLIKIKDFVKPMLDQFNNNKIRYHFDDRLKITPGFKFNEWEMKGVPIRIEVGPRDMKSKSIFISRRDVNEKKSIKIDGSMNKLKNLLDEIQSNMFLQAKKFRDENIFTVESYDEFKSIIKNGGFIRCYWDGSAKSEGAIKRDTKATIRCILLSCNENDKQCIYSGNSAKYEVVYAKAY
ncbi:MAG: His/Gly/Thr/Pro-type tRNA ligase C-terminal domain-containing protein, partial [SAR202 cluster bacterium]|nr:His/Gly/Thr/Pro-type tRNA ligase C-terminal domain-containing protein [SAR202 cluster bacterium]